MGESFDHRPTGGIRQSRKCCTKIIHNQMVVDCRSMSTANFAIRGFCPNVLALEAVLMILDLPGPQRRMANSQRAHRHRIIADMSLVEGIPQSSPLVTTVSMEPRRAVVAVPDTRNWVRSLKRIR